MFPDIDVIKALSNEEKSDILVYLLSCYSLKELCNRWGISKATYYRYIKNWGLKLPVIHRRKKAHSYNTKMPRFAQHQDSGLSENYSILSEKLLKMAHRTNKHKYPNGLLHAWSLNARGSYSLLSLLESVHESLEMKEGVYQIAIELTKISSPIENDNPPTSEKHSTLAYWMSTYEYPNDLQSIRSFEAEGLYAVTDEEERKVLP
ncbi:hypothetical protein ACFQI7_14165 [Paenibacillus allorhizosphaerae]|uniref:Helix-turn-helix domain-containing protein n=1 Tax=Paenibacillus allorhizosphaerae TaxID=2849866 RepID=A0ABN7TDR7_9BACL|nr:hypothetical protein [Paenibacillus allorhizosphaerae]CAG7626062.1 hypothetical protein PAECIP111802_01212 [Paenibacillus allorhizosphaerae]